MADKKILSTCIYELGDGRYEAHVEKHGRDGDSFYKVCDNFDEAVDYLRKMMLKFDNLTSEGKSVYYKPPIGMVVNCDLCGRSIFGGVKGLETHKRKNH